MKALFQPVSGESWKSFASVVLGVWLVVWLYAALHNQYLIRIAPEHFTVWHYKMPFIKDYTLLGIAYAGGASVSPGIVLGMLLFVAGRLGERPKLPPAQIICSTIWVWVFVEICAASTGMVVWHTGQGIYPDEVYPEFTRGLLTTQTIQITAYLSGAVASLFLIFWTWHRRKRLAT